MSHPIQVVEPTLHSVDPFEILDMCPVSDDFLPSDEVFLESLIHSDLILDVGSVVTKSNHLICLVSLIFPWIGLLMLVLLSFWTLP